MPTLNLPPQATPFIGRTQELNDLTALLADPACRLLTLVGPGGIGKTRLAIEAASRLSAFPDGVHFVPLQALPSPDHVTSTIASAIGFQFYPGGEPRQQLLNYLRKKRLLLLLDNFEHLLDGVSLLTDILAAAPAVEIMITSRERLNLVIETIYNVAGMGVPDASHPLDDAVKLFVQSARRLRPGFVLDDANTSDIRRICQLVGGMPLAILLAAAWVEMLPLSEIAVEIEHSLEFLETEIRDLPERHHSIRVTFDASWRRLSEIERAVFMKLSIFRGGFTREAAKAVTGASLKALMALVNQSFVQAKVEGRYDLHELLRQYGEEKLRQLSGAYEQVRDAHCAWYAAFCNGLADDVRGEKRDQALALVASDLENCRSGWRWAAEHQNRTALWGYLFLLLRFFSNRSQPSEQVALMEEAIEQLETVPERDDLQVTLRSFRAVGYYTLGLNQLAVEEAQKMSAWFRQAELGSPRRETAMVVGFLGGILDYAGNPVEGRQLIEQSIAECRANNYDYELFFSLSRRIEILTNKFAYDPEIGQTIAELRDIAQRTRNPELFINIHGFSGWFAVNQGHYAEAIASFQHALSYKRSSGSQLWLAESHYRLGQYSEAMRHCHEIIRYSLADGTLFNVEYVLSLLMQVRRAMGEKVRAVEIAAALSQYPVNTGVQDFAATFLTTLEPELPPEVFVAVLEYGKARDLETLLTELFPEEATPTAAPAASLPEPLTPRELQVLALLAAGRSNREICRELVLALGTVKRYISEIYGKLGVSSRTQAILRARELNLLS